MVNGDSACRTRLNFAKNPALMAAIGRFQKGDEIFYAKVVDGEIFRLR
ncbi:MAG: hypothetical protein JWM68_3317, partial [Verrucomicrobiales bacterium]|nr:hypothetical protein [Verrucomicrobiales bacterium]